MSKSGHINSFYGHSKQKRIKKYFWYGLFLFALFCIVKVWQNVSADQMIRHNQRLKAELTQMQYESSLLTLQLENVANVERIERLAHEKLGFVYAEKVNLDLGIIND